MDIGASVQAERTGRGWTLEQLSAASGVSRSMLSKVERGEASPTAETLVRIAAALSLTLSALIARAEGQGGSVVRAGQQPRWTDPATGYVRTHLSPHGAGALELIHVELPAGATVSFPATSYALIDQTIWLIAGRLRFREGDIEHELDAGDCLHLGAPADCSYHAPGPSSAVYLVAIARR